MPPSPARLIPVSSKESLSLCSNLHSSSFPLSSLSPPVDELQLNLILTSPPSLSFHRSLPSRLPPPPRLSPPALPAFTSLTPPPPASAPKPENYRFATPPPQKGSARWELYSGDFSTENFAPEVCRAPAGRGSAGDFRPISFRPIEEVVSFSPAALGGESMFDPFS